MNAQELKMLINAEEQVRRVARDGGSNQFCTQTYIAIVLGAGFEPLPPAGPDPQFRWQHLGVIGALAFVMGVVIWNLAK
jgi:hypothetical protein